MEILDDLIVVYGVWVCDHSNESYWAVLSCSTVYYAVLTFCGWNPSVWPFKWKLLSNIFKWRCLLLTILQNEIQDLSFELSTLGSKIVKATEPEAHFSFPELMLALILALISQVWTRHTDEETEVSKRLYTFPQVLNCLSYKNMFYFISLWSSLNIELTLGQVAHYFT